MTLTNEEAKELNRQRSDEANAEKAAAYKAQIEAASERAWFWFLKAHVGGVAVANGTAYWCCTANNELLSRYLKSQGLPVNEQNLETAFHVLLDEFQTGRFSTRRSRRHQDA